MGAGGASSAVSAVTGRIGCHMNDSCNVYTRTNGGGPSWVPVCSCTEGEEIAESQGSCDVKFMTARASIVLFARKSTTVVGFVEERMSPTPLPSYPL